MDVVSANVIPKPVLNVTVQNRLDMITALGCQWASQVCEPLHPPQESHPDQSLPCSPWSRVLLLNHTRVTSPSHSQCSRGFRRGHIRWGVLRCLTTPETITVQCKHDTWIGKVQSLHGSTPCHIPEENIHWTLHCPGWQPQFQAIWSTTISEMLNVVPRVSPCTASHFSIISTSDKYLPTYVIKEYSTGVMISKQLLEGSIFWQMHDPCFVQPFGHIENRFVQNRWNRNETRGRWSKKS